MSFGLTRNRVAAASAAATVALCGSSAVVTTVLSDRMTELGRPDLNQVSGSGLIFQVAAASASAVGAFLLLRRPEHPVSWCLAALGSLIGLTGALQAYGLLGLVADPAHRHTGSAGAAVLASSLFVFFLVALALVCFLTPTGRALSPRWAVAARVMGLSGALWFVTIVLMPNELQSPFRGIQNPWGISELSAALGPVRVATGGVNNLLVLASFGSLVLRFKRSQGDERRQLLWLGVAVVPVPPLLLVSFIASRFHEDGVVTVAIGAVLTILPVAIGLAVAKTRLYDVDRILSRAASYLLLSALLAATYTAVVLLVEQGLGGASGGSTIAFALAAVAVASLTKPAHLAVQDLVDRRFSRRRYDALRLVRDHVAAPDPAVTIEEVLRKALRAPELRVSYWLADQGCWVTAQGGPVAPPTAAMTVTRAGRPIARVDALDLEPALVQAVLHEAEPELESAGLRAAIIGQLDQVRASRARLATAQVDERRRVERDLHDGAQQRLLGLAAQLQAALLNGHPERLREALEMGVAQSQLAVRDLRELANGLHPSVLSDGGLGAALEDLAGRNGVELCLADRASRYPPRIEATAWFIACEAISNSLKHAGAGRVVVRVERRGQQLMLCVEDDGCGGADPMGSGLRGITDRAEAVGGTLVVSTRQPCGTTVEAVLPCA